MTISGILLFPFTFIYSLLIRFRNHLYNIQYRPEFKFEVKIISVGNLSVGGTGKTPMVEYIISKLSEKYNVAVLSRGYLRKSHGFHYADEQSSPEIIGDEPFQIYQKYKGKAHVFVCEDRAVAIPQILHQLPDTDCIVLDDAFQHRRVQRDLNILLTDYSKPFYNDHLLPSGRLREPRKEAARADITVITKAPQTLSKSIIDGSSRQVQKYVARGTPVFFSRIKYLDPIELTNSNRKISFNDRVFLFTGIANPRPISNYLAESYTLTGHLEFSDHHNYSKNDLKKIISRVQSKGDILITTEKDAMKLMSKEVIEMFHRNGLSLFYLPIKVDFYERGKVFDSILVECMES